MQISIEKIDNTKRKLTVNVPAEHVESFYQKEVDHFIKDKKSPNVDKFRLMNMKKKYVDTYHGAQVLALTLETIIQHALDQAVHQEQILLASSPSSIERSEFVKGQPWEFSALLNVIPEIETIQFSLNELEKPVVSIEKEDVDYAVRQLLKQYTQLEETDEPATAAHQICIDFYSIFNGQIETDHAEENYMLPLYQHKTLIPGFEENLIGVLPNEERTLHLHFPEDFAVQERAGQPVDFIVKVKKIFKVLIPVLNEKFIKELGISSGEIEDLRSEIKTHLQQEANRIIKTRIKEQVYRCLLEQNTMNLPMSIIYPEALKIYQSLYHNERQKHQRARKAPNEKEMAMLCEMARQRIVIGLLTKAYVKQHAIKVDEITLKQRIEEIAEEYYDDKKTAISEITSNYSKELEAEVLESQMIEKLTENIPIVPKEMNYAELKGIRYSE